MKEYKIDQSNKLIVKIGNIEEASGDALICWIAINLKAGPESFYKIHRKAGPQVLSSFILLEPLAKFSSAFTSIPGMMNFYTIIHSILPSNPSMFNDSFFNIIQTVKKYKESNICRDITFTFPSVNKKIIIEHLFTYTLLLENFTFNIIVDNDKEFKETIDILDNRLKGNFFKDLLAFFYKKISRLQ